MSIIFLIACFIILLGVITAISLPFWKKDPTTPDLISQEAAEDQERCRRIFLPKRFGALFARPKIFGNLEPHWPIKCEMSFGNE